MVVSWIVRRFRPRNLGYLSLALLSGENESDDEYDEKNGSPRGSYHDDDDRESVNETLVGDSPIETGLLADGFDEKACCRNTRPSRRERLVAALQKLVFLLPSFLVAGSRPPGKLHPSAWLDGLRGWAAFLVVWHHSSLLFFRWTLHSGWRSGEDPDDPNFNHIIQMPLIRLLIAGAPQVKIFFAISGFALSYKPLKLARAGRHAEWASALSSSAFRRHPRLFMPAVAILTLVMLAGYNRLFSNGENKWNDDAAMMTRGPPVKDDLYEQLWDLYGNVLTATNPFATDLRRSGTPYDWNLWTLGMEFDCSMILFLCLAAFSRLRDAPRLLLTTGVAAYALWYTHWPVFLFIAGMLICDLHFCLEKPKPSLLPSETETTLAAACSGQSQQQQNRRLVRAKRLALLPYYHAKRLILALPSCLPASIHSAVASSSIPDYVAAVGPTVSRFSWVSQTAYIRVSSAAMPQVHRLRPLRALSSAGFWRGMLSLGAVVTSLYLLSMPENNRGGRESPYYQTVINDWTPRNYEKDDENHWWLSLGAVLLVFTLERNPWLQRAFTTAFAQYLGRISYALYLVHGPLIFSLGWHLGRWCTDLTGRETERQYGLGVALTYALLWPVLIWAADIASRLVDGKSVEFTKWAYDRMVKKAD